jgi:hypothetical protein
MKKLTSVLYVILLLVLGIPAVAGMVSSAPSYFNHYTHRRQHRSDS